MQFTKEQLIAHITPRLARIKTDSRVNDNLRNEALMNKRVLEIALAALTAPELPPEGTGARGRSIDANYRRQGAKTGWETCLSSILGEFSK
jgi:hypothetical protein